MARKFFRILVVTLSSIGALIVLSPAAMADVQFVLTQPPGGYVFDNVYISPYTATIDGVSTPVICDDFLDDTFIGEAWKATPLAGSAADLSGTRMATIGSLPQNTDLAQTYDAAAWLAVQLLQPGISFANQSLISFAIWDLFSDKNTGKPSAMSVPTWLHQFGSSGDAFYASVQTEVTTALASATAGERSILTIYTPTSAAPTCGSGSCPTAPPQEFLVVNVPEASSPAILAFDLLALFGVVLFVRRRALPKAGARR